MKKNYTRPFFLILLLLSNVVAAQVTTTFSFTGGVQTYTVPAGVTFLDVTVKGAEGGAGTGTGGGAAGGQGGVVSGRLSVSPGTILYITVGSAGTPFSAGFNGGGTPSTGGGGGGGATDIRIGGTTTSNRVIVAAGGGGGGGGTLTGYAGGAGGGIMGTGQDGFPAATLGGKAGTLSVGGPGGATTCAGGTTTVGVMGGFGTGANGAGMGGAGGGGFYGGGGGGHNSGGTCINGAGGGGGGSSMVSTSVVSNYMMTQGGQQGNGSVTLITPQAPTVATISAIPQAPNWELTGSVLHNGAATNVFFEISNSPGLSSGVITVAYTSNPIQTSVVGLDTVTELVGGLLANTTYYYRIKAVNSVGTTNGSILSFTTSNTKPEFITGAAQNITMCQNTKDYQLTSLLHAKDTDPAQSITWSVAQMPNKNGTLGGFSSANTSVAGSANITPGNAITYTPITGFKGTETFKIQISDGKESDTITFTATVNPLPAPIISRTGLQLTTGAFDIYQWYRNNTAIVGASTQNYTMTEGGEYHVTVTDVNGCTATSNIFKYPTVSVDDVGAPAIQAYPNPVLNVLHVDAPEGSSVSIMGMDGKVAIAELAGRVDVSTLVPGVYVLRIYNAAGSLLQTSKLIRSSE